MIVSSLALGVLGAALYWSRPDAPARAPSGSTEAPTAAVTGRATAAARVGSERPATTGGAAVAMASAGASAGSVSHRVAYDPTRPLHGGEPIRMAEAPATAALAARRPDVPPCPPSSDKSRASGQCGATFRTPDGEIRVDLRGEARLTIDGVLHIDSGTATVRNLSAAPLTVVDRSGRRFDVAPLSKIDVDDPPPTTAPPDVPGSAVTPTKRPPASSAEPVVAPSLIQPDPEP